MASFTALGERVVPRLTTVIVGALGALAITACGASSGSGSGNSQSKSSAFVVGAAEPLSGTYAAAGLDIVHALKAEADIINTKGGILGHHVQVVSVDTGSDPQKAISAVQQLVNSHTLNMFEPDVIYGATQLPLTKNFLSVNICAAPDCSAGSKYPLNFTLNPPAADQVPSLVAYAKQHRYTKVGILATNDAQGTYFTQQATSDAKAGGVTIAGTQSFSPTATDISAEVQALKGSGAEAIFTWAAGATITTVMKAVQTVGLNVAVLGTPTVFTAPVEQLVPAPVQKQLICLCYSSGIRTGAQPPAALAALVAQLKPYGTVASMMVASLAADTLSLADYGYTTAGSLDAAKAAAAIQNVGSSATFPASNFWAFRSGPPHYTASVHAPASAPLAKGFYGVAKVSPLVDGMYLGTTPFTF